MARPGQRAVTAAPPPLGTCMEQHRAAWSDKTPLTLDPYRREECGKRLDREPGAPEPTLATERAGIAAVEAAEEAAITATSGSVSGLAELEAKPARRRATSDSTSSTDRNASKTDATSSGPGERRYAFEG